MGIEVRVGGATITDGAATKLASALLGTRGEPHAYDLVASETASSRGYGSLLMARAETIASREGCGYLALACGREREGALRFYEEPGFERPGYCMRKRLN